MFESEKSSNIEKKKKGLYSRNGEADDFTLRRRIHDTNSNKDIPENWQEPEQNTESPLENAPKERMSVSKVIFIASFMFFVIAVTVALFSFFGGSHLISADNIDISAEGPVSISGGDKISLDLSVINKNATDIELVDLIVEYPEGIKNPSNVSQDLTRERFSLGNIKALGVAQKKIEAVVFGAENERKTFKFTIEYRAKDSNAIFYKEKTYELIVSSSPIIVKIDALKKINSGQEMQAKVTVSSNSDKPIENLLLVFDYPFGFSFSGSDPRPQFGNNVFSVGDLPPTGSRTFTIMGKIEGQDSEERVLRANIGIESATNNREIATNILSSEHSFVIERPFVGLELGLGGTLSGDYPTKAGENVRVDIKWTNNLPVRISNAVIEVKLTGNMVNKSTVSPGKGFYDSINNTITWDNRNDPTLSLISPNKEGRLSFTFSTIRMSPGSYPTNPEVGVSVSVKGSRVDESSIVEELSETLTRLVKVNAELVFAGDASYSSGPFTNTGPIPPRANSETTYTITWTIGSISNSMSRAEVRTVLPAYVGWLGVVSPNSQNVSFNPIGGEVVWDVGDISKAEGGSSSSKSVSFQVSLMPSITQVGKILDLTGEMKASAIDDYSGATVYASGRQLNTMTKDSSSKISGTVVAQ